MRMKSIHNLAYQQLLALLREKRTGLGVTQEELARRLGVRQGIISKIETHERRIDLLELRAICSALGISFVDFVRQIDDCLTNNEQTNGENKGK